MSQRLRDQKLLLIFIALILTFITISSTQQTYPSGSCPEMYNLNTDLKETISNQQEASSSLRGTLNKSTNSYLKNLSLQINPNNLQFRNITIGQRQVEAWIYSERWAIDMSGRIYARSYCQ